MLAELLSDMRYRLRAIFRRRDVENDLDDELRFHLQFEADRLVRLGAPRVEAERLARVSFGSMDAAKESSRDARGIGLLEHVTRDLMRSFRLALRQPAFSIVVVLSLATGIGAVTAAFSLTYNILFATLQLPHPEQLVTLLRRTRDDVENAFSWSEYHALRETPGIGRLTATRGASAVSVEAGARRERINIHFVDVDYFAMTGVHPIAGRLIASGDDTRPIIVLSQQFAERLFESDSAIVGRTILIRGAPFVVVGVTPGSFRGLEFPGGFTAAIPMGTVPLLGGPGAGHDNRGIEYGAGDERFTDRRAFQIVGRLAVQPAVAEAALGRALERCCTLERGERLEMIGISHGMPSGKRDFRPQARLILAILLTGMGLVLVVVCCNIASLLLVRTSARQREIAVRLALGASRARLASQLIIENAPLAFFGGLGGLFVGSLYTALFVRGLPMDFVGDETTTLLGFQASLEVLAFTAAVTIVCGIACAVYPAVRATRQGGFAQALRLDARASRARGQGVVARGVVVVQVAATTVLVSAASLLAATLGNLSKVDGGFAVDHVLLARLELRSTQYERRGVAPISDEILRRVKGIQGVRAATMTTCTPMYACGNWWVSTTVPGFERAPGQELSTRVIVTAPGYLQATEIGLVSGRELAAADDAAHERVAVVSAAFARRYYADRDPLGSQIGLRISGDGTTNVRIVGVARDAKYHDLRSGPEPLAYISFAQAPASQTAQLLVRTEGEPSSLFRPVSSAVVAAAPGLAPDRLRDMRTARDQAVALERLAGSIASFVSLVALVLSVIGLYGVLAYSVSRRTSEIGIRRALGASAASVLWLVARETMALLGVGLLAGLPLSFAASGALKSQLFGVSAFDPTAVAVTVFVLATAGLAASVIPARRATHIDPRIALIAD